MDLDSTDGEKNAMKKETKKLTLSRETLRKLEERELREIAGGDTFQNSCDTITRWGCSRTTC
jgi:natural product precursor